MDIRKRKKNCIPDNRGMTLVELICSITVFSLIAVVVGGVMAVSTRTYRTNTIELDLQQEAQFAANRIKGLVQEAEMVSFSGGTDTDGSGSWGALIIDNGTQRFAIARADGANVLMYGEADITVEFTAIGMTSQLAGDIQSFSVDTSRFTENGTVRLDITVGREDSHYDLSTQMISRNVKK